MRVVLLAILLLSTSINLFAQTEQSRETIFERYPWLLDYVDSNNCNAEKITVYNFVIGIELLLETNEGSYIFYNDGFPACTPQAEVILEESCPDFLYRDISNVVETWECGGVITFNETVDDVIKSKAELSFFSIATSSYGADLSTEGPFTVFAPDNNALTSVYENIAVFGFVDPPANYTATLNNHVVEGVYRSTDLFDGQILTSLSGKELKVNVNSNGVFVNGAQVTTADLETTNGVVHIVNRVLSLEPILGDYPWLESFINFEACTNEKVSVYQSGSYFYVYIQGAENKGELFTRTGQSFCDDEGDFTCLELYRFQTVIDNWTCPNFVEPTPQTEVNGQASNPRFFETYNWLSDEVNTNNCNTEKITVYNSGFGTTQYLYIEDANGGSLYTDYGVSFCTSTSGNSCVDTYRLTIVEDSWSCNDDGGVVNPPIAAGELPQELKDLEWLNDKVDFNNCAGSSIEIYDFGSYSFVYITTNGTTTMYLNNGTFYCEESGSYSCKSLYGINRAADVSWNCGGVNKTSNHPLNTDLKKNTDEVFNYQVYPNPSNGLVYLDISKANDQIQQVNFYNMMGKLIVTKTFNDMPSKQIQFNLNEHAKGLYMIELLGENIRATEKLIIE